MDLKKKYQQEQIQKLKGVVHTFNSSKFLIIVFFVFFSIPSIKVARTVKELKALDNQLDLESKMVDRW